MSDLRIEYTRRLYDEVRKWYESAIKAQVALGIVRRISGVFDFGVCLPSRRI